MRKYPNPCNQCGLCCMSEVCPAGRDFLGIYEEDRRQPCPLLRWDGDTSRCGLMDDKVYPLHLAPAKAHLRKEIPDDAFAEMMGFGAGCCISARVYQNGKVKDFASLPDKEKTKYAQQYRNQITKP